MHGACQSVPHMPLWGVQGHLSLLLLSPTLCKVVFRANPDIDGRIIWR
jgi:hypothetical protein